jgi:predicted flap endonuclease-1-like 5' DNA nuclease
MSSFRDEIARLTNEINALRELRELFVENLRKIVAEMQTEFRQARMKMARNTRARIAACLSDILTFVRDLENRVRKMQATFRDDHAEMAERSKAELSAFVSALKTEISEMLAGFRGDREDKAEETAADLSAFLSDLKTFARNLKSEVSRMMTVSRKSRAKVSAETKAELHTFTSNLLATVRELRGKAAAMIQEFADDIAGARQAWRSITQKPEDSDQEVQNLVEALADDLTVIPGIGVRTQERLRRARIQTYSQLAEKSAQQLRGALENRVQIDKVQNWISHARKLSKVSKQQAKE